MLFGLLALILIKTVEKHEVRQGYVTRCFSDNDMKGAFLERQGYPVRGELRKEGMESQNIPSFSLWSIIAVIHTFNLGLEHPL